MVDNNHSVPSWHIAMPPGGGVHSIGYKRRGGRCEQKRRRILDSLRAGGIPIRDADAEAAVRDADGDAVDALVLLAAARTANGRATDWSDAVGDHAEMEGWFFD